MISQLINRLYVGADKKTSHPNWMLRRAAQATVVAIGALQFGARKLAPAGTDQSKDRDLVEFLSSSERLRSYIFGSGLLRPSIGLLSRVLLARTAFADMARERTQSDYRTFAIRIDGPIDQRAIRNLLIWHNQILAKYRAKGDLRPIDVMLVLGRDREESRLFDFMAIALMLERLRNITVFWCHASADSAAPLLLSELELARWGGVRQAENLLLLPLSSGGRSGGLKLLSHGRRRSNDFFKIALPHRVVIAVSLLETSAGRIDQSDLTKWLERFAEWRARDEDLAVVILNSIAPSQRDKWPSEVLIARDSGFSLQETVSLAQIADAYCGVLDVFGMAAHAAGRPGIYIPFDAADQLLIDEKQEEAPAQIISQGADDASVEDAISKFFAAYNVRTSQFIRRERSAF